MANPKHLKILLQGEDAWNTWRLNHLEVRPDLAEANLRGANLRGADLNDANLHSADLTEAMLYGADLTHANLKCANLTDAYLKTANLFDANLKSANLTDANLHYAQITLADLCRANFSKAHLKETLFADLDLSVVTGLDTCVHVGPSIIDFRTLSRSGPLPLAFLRGCGLPDTLIDYLPSLLNQPIQFDSCFISYSTKDQEFADRLHADLQNKGVRCWFAPHDMQAGRKIHEQIDRAIQLHDRLLWILSPASMDSEWVKTEIAKARKRERQESRRVLFPVRLLEYKKLQDWECFDADAGKDSAREIREYYIPDFSNWKDHDAYRTEFDKLLRDLKPHPEPLPTLKMPRNP